MNVEPSKDDLDRFRQFRDEAMAADTGDPFVDAYERGAIEMDWESFVADERAEVQRPLTDTLRLQLLGVELVDSYTLGTVSRAVQTAVAKVDRARRRPNSRTLSVDKADRANAEIIQQAQVGNTVIFRVPAAFQASGGYDIGSQPGRAGAALRELVETLPKDAGDNGAVEGILGSPQMIRLAVQDISRAAQLLPKGLELDLQTGGGEVKSIMTRDHASKLYEYLEDRDTLQDSETVVGKLDGFRGTRRVFYLIKDDNSEIVGSIEEHLLPAVRALEGKRVQANVNTTQWRARSGKLGKKSYGLVAVELASEAPNLFEELD